MREGLSLCRGDGDASHSSEIAGGRARRRGRGRARGALWRTPQPQPRCLSWFRGPRRSSRVPPAQGPQGRLGFSINDKMSGNRFYRVQLTERGDVPSCGTWTHSSRRTWGQGWGWRGPRGWKVRSLSGATQTRLSYEAEERRVACMPRGGSHAGAATWHSSPEG